MITFDDDDKIDPEVEKENKDLSFLKCSQCGIEIDLMNYCQVAVQKTTGEQVAWNLCPDCERALITLCEKKPPL